MRLLSLEVENFRAVRSAKLSFGPGLTVVYGPNDLGKSTITEAIRAAFLTPTKSSEAHSYVSWGGSDLPRVVATFQAQDTDWRVEKIFGSGTRAKAYLQKSTGAAGRFHREAEGRDVEGRLRALLSWGISPPGGRGAPARPESFLATALLGRQGEVSSILAASLKGDQDDTGRVMVTQALGAMGQDPVLARLLDRLDEQLGEAFTESGRQKRTVDSPLVRVQSDLKVREDRLRELEESDRQGRAVETQVIALLARRDEVLVRRDDAARQVATARKRQEFVEVRGRLEQVVDECRVQLQRADLLLRAVEESKQQLSAAESALLRANEEQEKAFEALDAADRLGRTAGERLARAQTSKSQALELARSDRERRRVASQMRRESALARLRVVEEARKTESEAHALDQRLSAARIDVERASAAVGIAARKQERATLIEQLTDAEAANAAATRAASDYADQKEREASATAALASAGAILATATADRDAAHAALGDRQRRADEHALRIQVRQIAETHAAGAADEARKALGRVIDAAKWRERSDAASRDAEDARSKAQALEIAQSANAAELSLSEFELREWRAVEVRLRRQALSGRIRALEQEADRARDYRQGATTKRSEATRLEQQAAARPLPSAAQEPSRRIAPGPVAAGLAASLIAVGIARFQLSISLGVAGAIGLGIALVVWITVASLLDRRSRDAAGQAPHFDASLDRMRRDADTLRRNAAAEDEAAANASAAAAGLHSLRQEDGDLSRQDDGGEQSSVADRLREVGQDVQAASKRLADEQVRVTALRSDRDRLSQARALAVPVAEAARLRFETISGDYERSLESAGDCTEDALIAARARVSDAENNFQQVRATRGTVDNGDRAVEIPHAESRLRQSEQAVTNAQANVAARQSERDAQVRRLATAHALLNVAEQARGVVSLEDVRARLDALGVEDSNGIASTRASAAADYENQRNYAAECASNVRTLERDFEEARRLADRLISGFGGTVETEATKAELEYQGADDDLKEIDDETLEQSDTVVRASEEAAAAERAADSARTALEAAKKNERATNAALTDVRAAVEHARATLKGNEREAESIDRAALEARLQEATQDPSFLTQDEGCEAGEVETAEEALETANQELKSCEANLNESRGRLHLISGHVGTERLEQQREAVERAREYADEKTLDYEAAHLLRERLEEAESSRTSHLGRTLAAPVTKTFLELTQGRYRDVTLDPDLSTEGVVAFGATREVGALSVGTREQLATLIRLAVAAHLKTTIILDDQLVHSDSERLAWFRERLRTSVREYDHQAIVFTCRAQDYLSEDELTGGDGQPVGVIDLKKVVAR